MEVLKWFAMVILVLFVINLLCYGPSYLCGYRNTPDWDETRTTTTTATTTATAAEETVIVRTLQGKGGSD